MLREQVDSCNRCLSVSICFLQLEHSLWLIGSVIIYFQMRSDIYSAIILNEFNYFFGSYCFNHRGVGVLGDLCGRSIE